MSGPRKTAIVTGVSQGIGAGIVKGFVERGFNVVANSRKVTQFTDGAGIMTAASLPMAALGAESQRANPPAS
jgi:NAD(P)-dependent dehydrogenase (short-subunit alcohol dehydrogenase family)